MYQNILIPLDPGHIDDSDAAIELAMKLKDENAKMTLLSIIEEIPAYVSAQIPQELISNARTHAHKKLKGLVKKHDLDAEVMVVSGHAASTIKSIQKKIDSDLLIISSHKPTSIDFMLGSTASSVVRGAQCAVHVLR